MIGWKKFIFITQMVLTKLTGCISKILKNTGNRRILYLHAFFYLHQAASSEWWPAGITYDPDNSGTPIGSLGVHEHWNNVDEMQYSRNLETGEGIELVKIFEEVNFTDPIQIADNLRIFPNPCSEIATISWVQDEAAEIQYRVVDINGRMVFSGVDVKDNGNYKEVIIDVRDLQAGVYFVILSFQTGEGITTSAERLVVQ